MFDNLYSKITSKIDYRILTAAPPVIAVFLLGVFFLNGVSFGLEFSGGTWVEVTTDRSFTPDSLASIKSGLASAGLKDLQVYSGRGIGSSQNTLTIVTTDVVEESRINSMLSPYVGALTSNDVAFANLSSQPPSDFRDKMLSRFKNIDIGVKGNVVNIKSLELNTEEVKSAMEYYLNQKVDLVVQRKNLNIRSVGATLGKTFREQAITAIFFSFILMSLVVFFAFREIIPSIAVLQAAVNDTFIALGCMSIFGIPFDSASLGALLMIIGYSVDTDILLTTRVLRRKGREVDESIDGGVKTGLMMDATTIGVMCVTFIVTTFFIQISTLRTISAVLLFGLVGDIFTTFLTNAGLLKWLAERKRKGGVRK